MEGKAIVCNCINIRSSFFIRSCALNAFRFLLKYILASVLSILENKLNMHVVSEDLKIGRNGKAVRLWYYSKKTNY
jgi:hypothetical protein